MPLAVMLQSVGAHLAPGLRAVVHVLSDGLTASDRQRISSSVPGNLDLDWREPVELGAGLPLWGRMSATTYQKLALADWLPAELGKVLWLDCDMLVLADVTELWQRPLGSWMAMAVPDERVPLVSSRFGVAAWRELKLAAEAPHFNAGLLLANLVEWRAQRVFARTLEYVRDYRERMYFWDQEALNGVLSGQWLPLDARWNRHPAYAAPGEQPWILHFSGNLKPWLFEGHSPHRARYREYLSRTAWASTVLPSSWFDRWLERYETSHLRHRWLMPLEETAMILRRKLTRI